ncbi:MAG: hypothetical protein K2I91_01135 [Muribaculaceae bacterium]|nr:hypothetical protein [Muribaculaceae bacterium]
MKRVKLSELPELTDLDGLYTFATDDNNKSGRVSLEKIRGKPLDLSNLSEEELSQIRSQIGSIKELTPEEIVDIAEREYKLYINP